jgi:hypothetical protein
LLETRIAKRLDQFADHLSVNVVFSDPETGQSRELDAYCFKVEISEYHEFFEASSHLLIECINNPQPIAFFSSARPTRTYPITASRPAWLGSQPIEESIKIGHFHHHFKGPEATNYCTFVTKKSGEWMVTHADDQHREFTTLAALAQLVREKQKRSLDEISHPHPMGVQCCGIAFIYPMLVVQGALFEVQEASPGGIHILEVDHVRYVKSHIWKNTRRYCPIDIVTERSFPKLLEQIQIECRRTLGRMELHADEILAAANSSIPRDDDATEDFLP